MSGFDEHRGPDDAGVWTDEREALAAVDDTIEEAETIGAHVRGLRPRLGGPRRRLLTNLKIAR
jgi:hypothetical protein